MQAIQTITHTLNITEVFKTASGTIFQSDSENCWYIDFAGKLNRFDYRCLQKLRKAVYHIDIEGLLMNTNRSADMEIVFICACDHTYILTTLEIIALKELLQGTFTMLELNHIIHDRLYRGAL
ncbi:hypothetical protein [Mucilaginibacter polytrichastri]|uniref:Uncharacterized protein n=1 Tax=Mucilaginibacter polytrichastri TaxID=1302689 RepID=A0A1Q5ZUC0_9SPHI|nr:hypothetical protein [Mucilaginibacter polytrichastri]OKS85369.1 hypothetical protein RG47T_0814 [Mucilaginibacter polytrichastri]SFS39993.1 hypothetical protein SAMN04487890_101279 [Mucilaginibacter polytrichastri]